MKIGMFISFEKQYIACFETSSRRLININYSGRAFEKHKFISSMIRPAKYIKQIKSRTKRRIKT